MLRLSGEWIEISSILMSVAVSVELVKIFGFSSFERHVLFGIVMYTLPPKVVSVFLAGRFALKCCSEYLLSASKMRKLALSRLLVYSRH